MGQSWYRCQRMTPAVVPCLRAEDDGLPAARSQGGGEARRVALGGKPCPEVLMSSSTLGLSSELRIDDLVTGRWTMCDLSAEVAILPGPYSS